MLRKSLLNIFNIAVVSSIFFSSSMLAQEEVEKAIPENIFENAFSHEFKISPIFGMGEMKQGEQKQSGEVYGLSAKYTFLNAFPEYVSIEMGYKSADLSGSTLRVEDLQYPAFLVLDDERVNKFSDFWAEIHIGHCFLDAYETSISPISVTPFLILGYESEKDNFYLLDGREMSHKLTYGYFGIGTEFLMQMQENLKIGLNLKFQLAFNAKSEIADEYSIRNSSISHLNDTSFKISLPIEYKYSDAIYLNLSPFYEVKNYAENKLKFKGKEDASFSMFGIMLQVSYAV